MSKRLDFILKENADFEKQAPYNFCDRWCERCPMDTQHRCKLYLDDFERQITNIAHGREFEIGELMFRAKDQLIHHGNSKAFPLMREHLLDVPAYAEEPDDDMATQQQILKRHALYRLVCKYRQQTHHLLRKIYFQRDDLLADEQYDFETIAWYHTFLPVKIFQVLKGLYRREYSPEDKDVLRDLVAQCAICKKAIAASDKAWSNISRRQENAVRSTIEELVSSLYTLCSRIKAIEYRV